jgi:cell filamentation protein
MKVFERNVLQELTPCNGVGVDEFAVQIAPVHAELLLIHPYREGNGRTARLLATLLAYQAGMPGIDFSFIKSRGKEFEKYVHAIHAALNDDYLPMKDIIKRGLVLAQRSV